MRPRGGDGSGGATGDDGYRDEGAVGAGVGAGADSVTLIRASSRRKGPVVEVQQQRQANHGQSTTKLCGGCATPVSQGARRGGRAHGSQ